MLCHFMASGCKVWIKNRASGGEGVFKEGEVKAEIRLNDVTELRGAREVEPAAVGGGVGKWIFFGLECETVMRNIINCSKTI